MFVHGSLVVLRAGKAVVGPIEHRGRCIAAGCSSSNAMVKGYANRSIHTARDYARRDLECDNGVGPNISGFEATVHVDDVSMLMRARKRFGSITYSVSKLWAGIVTGDLKLGSSDKNNVLPSGPAGNAAVVIAPISDQVGMVYIVAYAVMTCCNYDLCSYGLL